MLVLADKFDNRYDYVWTLESLELLNPTFTKDDILKAEREVLHRIDYAIPVRTEVSDLFDMLGEEYNPWIFAVLEARWLKLMTPYEWACVLHAANRGYFWSIVQLMAFQLSTMTIAALGLARGLLTEQNRKRTRCKANIL